MLINLILIPLVLTIIIEVTTSLLIYKPNIRCIIAIIIVNITTNPAINFVVWIIRLYTELSVISPVTIILEIVVIYTEWRLLLYMLYEDKYRMLLLAVFINISSYVAGMFML